MTDKLTWHMLDDDPRRVITLYADGRIEGDINALRTTMANVDYKFGSTGDGMGGLVQTVIWLLVRELERQQEEKE